MITEDYVSYEVAKLLKEKGFVEKTFTYFDNELLCHGEWFEWNNSPMGQISAPTLQMAMKWLREVHKLCIVIEPVVSDDDGDAGFLWSFKILKSTEPIGVSSAFLTYIETAEEAIKYSLKNMI